MAACEAKILGGAEVTATLDGGTIDSVPQGISTGIKHLIFTLNDTTWTLIGGIAGRRSLTIINTAVIPIFVANNFYDPLPADATERYQINAQSQGTFQARETVNIYGKLAAGAGSVSIRGMEFV